MQAVAFEQTGDVEVLKLMERPRPQIGERQVLVRVGAAGVNPADTLFRRGGLPFVRLDLPFIPGLDVAGVIEEVGPALSGLTLGGRVYGMLPNATMGGYAEYAAIDAASVAPVPQGMPLSEAAAVPCAGLTALQGLRDHLGVEQGTRLLINGASGGVGTFAVQLAKAMGAHVTGVCSTRNLELVRGLGADAVLDYTNEPLPENAFDAVFDAVGVLGYRDAARTLVRGGRGVTVNPLKGNPISAALARLGAKRWSSLMVRPSGADLEAYNAWWIAGDVQAVIDTCYPLADAQEAHRYSETKRVRGKLVLQLL